MMKKQFLSDNSKKEGESVRSLSVSPNATNFFEYSNSTARLFENKSP